MGGSPTDPGAVWEYPWTSPPAGAGNLSELSSGCRLCATCHVRCQSIFGSAVGCYSLGDECCERLEGLCQSLPQGFHFLVLAAAISAGAMLVHGLFYGGAHGVRFVCCGRKDSCSSQCRLASPFVLMGTAVVVFDFLTDANFYVTLSRDEKDSALGWACLALLAFSVVLIIGKVSLESCQCGLFAAETTLDEASRSHREASRAHPAAARAVKRSGTQTRCAAPARSADELSESRPLSPRLAGPERPQWVLQGESAVRRAHAWLLEARVAANSARSWHLTAQAKLCLAIVLFEDLPQLVVLLLFGKLNFQNESSRASIVGIGVSLSWALFQLWRGKRAAHYAATKRTEIEPARARAQTAMVDEIFASLPESSASTCAEPSCDWGRGTGLAPAGASPASPLSGTAPAHVELHERGAVCGAAAGGSRGSAGWRTSHNDVSVL